MKKCTDDGEGIYWQRGEKAKLKINSDNQWCDNCKEDDCCCSLDGTCEMIRKYLRQLKFVELIDRCKDMSQVRRILLQFRRGRI